MGFTTVPNKASGDTFTEQMWDDYIRDNVNWLEERVCPVGTILPYAGTTSPNTDDWLLCDGSAVSRTTYADLFALIAVTFGSGDGSTTFNVPDLRGRVPMCLDNLGGAAANVVTDADADSLGGTDGDESHILSAAEMPQHNHGGSGTTSTESATHGHGLTTGGFVRNQAGGGSLGYAAGANTASVSASTDQNVTTHTHTYSFTTDNAGSGNGHNNLQPFIALGYIIKG